MQKKDYYGDQLLQYIEHYFPNLRENIELQVIVTPEDFRKRTWVDHHAFGGLAPHIDNPQLPFETPIQGLWFVGVQSESGGGLNNVMPGAFKTAKKIEKLIS